MTKRHMYIHPTNYMGRPVGKVFNSALNPGRVGMPCRVAGSEFQTVGIMKLKARSPADLRLCLGTFKSFSSE